MSQIRVVKTKAISKIFREADELPTIAEKVAFLRSWENPQLREIVRHAFDPAIKYDITISPVAKEEDDWSSDGRGDLTMYRPLGDDGTNEGAFIYEIRKRIIYLIEGGPGDVMTEEKRNALFHSILESINPEDAELLLAVKDKQWPYGSLTPTVLNEAFPNLIPVAQAAEAVVKKTVEKRKPAAKKAVKKTAKKAATKKKA